MAEGRELDAGAFEAHLGQVAFQTGAFFVAWSWVLVYYAASHVLSGQSPLEAQIGMGGADQLRSLPATVFQYVSVCALASYVSSSLRARTTDRQRAWAGVKAIEFFPSPVFSGLLMAFLGQFPGNRFHTAVLNLAASWSIALVVYLLPRSGGLAFDIVRQTVGFGLGVAWNSVVSGICAGSERLALHTLYLAMAIILAARFAAPDGSEDSICSRHRGLLSFSMRVVVAFALADWLGVALGPSWIAGLSSLALVAVLAAALARIVAKLDLDRVAQQEAERKAASQGSSWSLLGCLAMVPCCWCCCPGPLLLWMLAGSAPGVKDRWLHLSADVCSLAASVIGSGLLTRAADAVVVGGGLCGPDPAECAAPWSTTGVQAVFALVASWLLLAGISPLASPPPAPEVPNGAGAHLLNHAHDETA